MILVFVEPSNSTEPDISPSNAIVTGFVNLPVVSEYVEDVTLLIFDVVIKSTLSEPSNSTEPWTAPTKLIILFVFNLSDVLELSEFIADVAMSAEFAWFAFSTLSIFTVALHSTSSEPSNSKEPVTSPFKVIVLGVCNLTVDSDKMQLSDVLEWFAFSIEVTFKVVSNCVFSEPSNSKEPVTSPFKVIVLGVANFSVCSECIAFATPEIVGMFTISVLIVTLFEPSKLTEPVTSPIKSIVLGVCNFCDTSDTLELVQVILHSTSLEPSNPKEPVTSPLKEIVLIFVSLFAVSDALVTAPTNLLAVTVPSDEIVTTLFEP